MSSCSQSSSSETDNKICSYCGNCQPISGYCQYVLYYWGTYFSWLWFLNQSPTLNSISQGLNNMRTPHVSYELPQLSKDILESRLQNFIKARSEDEWFEGFPKMKALLFFKNAVNKKRNHPPLFVTIDYTKYDLTNLGRFDVIYIDLPLQEYYDRLQPDSFYNMPPHITNQLLQFDNVNLDRFIESLPIKEISENQAFLFMWVG